MLQQFVAVIHFKALVTLSSPASDISYWYITSCKSNSLVTLKTFTNGDEWILFIIYTFSTIYKDLGDELVTSAFKWITAVSNLQSASCSAMGDELQSYVKNLFFKFNPPFLFSTFNCFNLIIFHFQLSTFNCFSLIIFHFQLSIA